MEKFADCISLISDAMVAIAAILGIAGLWQWRKELIGRSKFEIATKMTLLALQFRDEFNFARGMATFKGEAADREKQDDEAREESQVLDEYYARIKRFHKVQGTLQKLSQAGWEAEVLLSDQDTKLVKPFEDLVKQLYISIEIYFSEQNRMSKSKMPMPQDDSGYLMRHHEVIYTRGADDELSKKVDEAVTTLKKQLKKYIK